MMPIKILVTDPLSEAGLRSLTGDSRFQVVINTELSQEELFAEIRDADALLVRSQTTVNRELINRAPQLKIIGRAGVGVDNIDLEAATEHGIMVVNAPGGNTNSAAEHTIAMLLSLARNIPQAYQSLKKQEWKRSKYQGIEVKGKTLGVIGFGKIGAEVAHRAKGQRMNVIAYDPFMTPEKAQKLGILNGSIDDILENADFITVHTPLIKETTHLLNKEAFQKMKQGVRILNCARGGIIYEAALLEAIEAGIVAGAALDVFETEPPFGSKLLERDEVIATPHLGGSTVEAQENVAIGISQDVLHFFSGQAVEHPVNLPAISKETLHHLAPYFDLAKQLGRFISFLAYDGIQEISIQSSGGLAEHEVSTLARNVVKGLLERFASHQINSVNALYLAEQKGISLNESKTTKSGSFPNLLTVEVISKSGSRIVSGTILEGFGPRIVRVDGYHADIAPQGHLLLIEHQDKPGAIGRMGSLLGEHRINIATMQVDREENGGRAIMLLTVDKHPGTQAISELERLDDIEKVTAIDLI